MHILFHREVASYYDGQQSLLKLHAMLRNSSDTFDLCRKDDRMVPSGIFPMPVQLRMGRGAGPKAAEEVRGEEGEEGEEEGRGGEGREEKEHR